MTDTFTQNDYELVKRDVIYQGFFCLTRYTLRIKKYDGTLSSDFTREVFERRSAAAILPYDPLLDEVVLIEQFRPGALSNPQSPWLLETIAGVYDPNDDPRMTATKEAEEEAGCKILDLYRICGYFVSPGGSNEYLHLFCGRIDATDVGGIFGLPEENEDIRAFALPAEEAFALVQEGKIQTSPAIIALQWLQLNREWLKQLWQTK